MVHYAISSPKYVTIYLPCVLLVGHLVQVTILGLP
jgi:hypothetical protein